MFILNITHTDIGQSETSSKLTYVMNRHDHESTTLAGRIVVISNF